MLTIQLLATCTSTLSAIGCLFVLIKIWLSDESGWSLANKLLIVLSTIDLITSIFWGIGISGASNPSLCTAQAFMIQWGSLASIMWNTIMAHLMHKLAVRKKHEDRIKRKLRRYILATVLIPFFVAFVLLFCGVYGDAVSWCWIDNSHQGLRFFCFYFFLLFAWTYNAYMLRAVSISIHSRADHYGEGSGLLVTETIIQSRIRLYMLVFVFTWFFGILNRFVQYVNDGHADVITSYLCAAIVPSQGLLNAICYGGLFDEDSLLIKLIRSTWLVYLLPISGLEDHAILPSGNYDHHQLPPQQQLFTNKPKYFSIFCSTLNIGECPIEDLGNIDDWIPKGHDIYVIGLQECLCLEELRHSISFHLGGPEIFKIHTTEIGSSNTALGYHGFIALSVFIKISDLEDGSIRLSDATSGGLATGADLFITTASNKGAVGLPFQIHDTSIAFLTAHLPSDNKGVSKLQKRNKSAQAILREMSLTSEDIGCDLQLQHDHVVFLGDLNYRTTNNLIKESDMIETALATIASATSLELKTMQTYNYNNNNNNNNMELNTITDWMQLKYSLLNATSSSYPTEQIIHMIHAAKKSAKSNWDELIAYDELRHMLDVGEVFSGFLEVMPRFPPSYKWKKRKELGTHHRRSFSEMRRENTNLRKEEIINYSDLESLRMAYATGMKGGEHERRPSLERPFLVRERKSSKELLSYSAPASASASEPLSSSSSISTNAIQHEVEGRKESNIGIDQMISTNNQMTTTQYGTQVNVTYDYPPVAVSAPIAVTDNSTTTTTFSSYDSHKHERKTSFSNKLATTQITSNNSTAAVMIAGSGSSSGKSKGLNAPPDNSSTSSSTSLRIPSYTDRILMHSLKEGEGRITPLAYEMCDTLRGSDHRPVSMVLKLEVNETVLPYSRSNPSRHRLLFLELTISGISVEFASDGFINPNSSSAASSLSSAHNPSRNSTPTSSTHNPIIATAGASGAGGTDAVTSSSGLIRNYNAGIAASRRSSSGSTISIDFNNLPSTAKDYHNTSSTKAAIAANIVEESGSVSVDNESTVHEVTVVFPLPTKDPLLDQRKMFDLATAFRVHSRDLIRALQRRTPRLLGGTGGSGIIGGGGGGGGTDWLSRDTMLKSSHIFLWESLKKKDLQVTGGVDPMLGVHVLLKLTSRGERDLGQCVVGLSSLLRSDLTTSSEYMEASLSSGGQRRGVLRGTFTLRHLSPSLGPLTFSHSS